ncbi:transglutaminase domain-containing protein [bacterium]|nr:transglutaminase domain-containing protein [bacterium]
MTNPQSIPNYYATPGPLTDPGKHSDRLRGLPDDVDQLVKVVHQLGIYDVFASDFYGVKLADERVADIHLRSAESMLDAVFAVHDQPLTARRTPEQRIGCRCHAFTKFILTLLRAKGIPARARCGFAVYFGPGQYEDHWVCEYWNTAEGHWVLVDAQMDEVWQEKLNMHWDVLDVPRDRFLVAADAWTRCRNGEANPEHFGISFYEDMNGWWFIAGNLVRDAAALNKMEMLPWDVWGAMPIREALTEEQFTYFDQLAELTRMPDDTFGELRARYHSDDGLRVPQTVFNHLRQQSEVVDALKSAQS